MGQPKQLLLYQGKTLIERAVDTTLSLPFEGIWLVLGAYFKEIREKIQSSKVFILQNTRWEEGMASSLKMGLSEALKEHPPLEGVLFLLCDQLHLTRDHLEKIMEAHQKTGKALVASSYEGIPGVPTLITRPFFPEILALQGDQGARKILRKNRDILCEVAFPAGKVDIDSPEDLKNLHFGD